MKGPKATRAVGVGQATSPLAEKASQKAEADRAMDKVKKVDGRKPGNPNLMNKVTIAKAKQARSARTSLSTAAEQSAEFERVAREHDAEGDERSFNEALRKMAKPKSVRD